MSEIQEDNGSGEAVESIEQIIELADKNIDIAKAGASISGANKTKIENIILVIANQEEVEESNEAEKSEVTDNLSKADDLQKSNDLLKGELDIAKSDLAKADERIKRTWKLCQFHQKVAYMQLQKAMIFQLLMQILIKL